MLISLCFVAIVICLVIIVFVLCDFQDMFKKKLEFEQACKVDAFVDNIINKAVIISEYITDKKDMSYLEYGNKKMEQACSITADVLLQHGIKPKDYNLPALIIVAQHKNHFIGIQPIKQGVN